MQAELVHLRMLYDAPTDERVRVQIMRLIDEIERQTKLMADGSA